MPKLGIPIAPLRYRPDLETSWAKEPGSLINMNALVPLQRGQYGSVGVSVRFAITGGDVLHAQLFRQTSGSVRMLVFRAGGDIDEYSAGGVRTNRETGLTAATTWRAAAWGNQIIATNYVDAPRSSTGAGFAALSGSPPRAKFVAANANFVAFANIDDGTAKPDYVAWSGIGNPNTWATSFATQAGQFPLRDAPGDVTGFVAYRDTFIAFKANAIFVGRYVGVQNGFGFDWRMISNRVGCIAPDSIVELDNKLYFVHTTGMWEYDGQGLRNASLEMWGALLNELGRIGNYDTSGSGGAAPPGGATMAGRLSDTRCIADDVEGVVQVMIFPRTLLTFAGLGYGYAFNVRSGLWSRVGSLAVSAGSGGPVPLYLAGSTSDLFDWQTVDYRAGFITNNGSNELLLMQYPAAAATAVAPGLPSITAGPFGHADGQHVVARALVKTMPGSDTAPFGTAALAGYADHARTITDGTDTMAYNSEFDCFDGKLRTHFSTVQIIATTGKKVIVAGLGVDVDDGGKR